MKCRSTYPALLTKRSFDGYAAVGGGAPPSSSPACKCSVRRRFIEPCMQVRSTAPPSSSQVRGWCEANRPTTGWTRSATGRRVANGPFAHATRGAVLGAAPSGGTAGAPSMQAPNTAPRGGARKRPAPTASEPGRPRRGPSVGAAPGAASSSVVTGPCTGPATGAETLTVTVETDEVRARGSRKTKARAKVDVDGTVS